MEKSIEKKVMIKSPKEMALDKALYRMTGGKSRDLLSQLIEDEEVRYLQEYANTVSIRRLGYNDHGPVHMRKVTLNALKMVELLAQKEINLTLTEEEVGTHEDSIVAIILAAFLHDIGMTMGRENHEHSSVLLTVPLIDRFLHNLYPQEIHKRVIIRSLALEGIVGHMAYQKIHSKEAGIILIADGCDMEKGRARIPMILARGVHVGDIHKYSASAIQKVHFLPGEEKPIKITVEMKASVGLYQIEEVLFRKIESSPIKNLIELYAVLVGKEAKRYL